MGNFFYLLKENEFRIDKNEDSKLWKVTLECETKFETENPNEIISYFEDVQRDKPEADQVPD